MNFGKKVITIAVLAMILSLIGAPMARAESMLPSLNTLCWQQSACTSIGGTFYKSFGDCKGGAVENPWGMCLPAGSVTTSIAFGGNNNFLHIGDYILTVYNYALGIVSIVAVAVLIIAGLQWMTSGGNSDMITRSKKRIFGVVIGLIIAYGSYLILYNINPATVNLRLPQVWMLREQKMLTEFCSDLDSKDLLFSLAADSTNAEQKKEIKLTGKEKFDLKYEDKTKPLFFCGKRFFVSTGGTCKGNYCSKSGELCINFDSDDTSNPNKYWCKQADIFVTLKCAGDCGPWESNQITNNNEQELWLACNNGWATELEYTETKTESSEGLQKFYLVSRKGVSVSDIDNSVKWCKDKQNSEAAGMFIKVEMNADWSPYDQNHFFGYGGGTNLVDLGGDQFVVAKDAFIKEATTDLSPGLHSLIIYKIDTSKLDKLIPVDKVKGGISLNLDDAGTIKFFTKQE